MDQASLAPLDLQIDTPEVSWEELAVRNIEDDTPYSFMDAAQRDSETDGDYCGTFDCTVEVSTSSSC